MRNETARMAQGHGRCKWCDREFPREGLTVDGFCSAECEEKWCGRNMPKNRAAREELPWFFYVRPRKTPRRPETRTLFLAVAGEAEACLHNTDWEDRIRRMENILCVIRERIRRHWEQQHMSELDRLVLKAKKERDANVGKAG